MRPSHQRIHPAIVKIVAIPDYQASNPKDILSMQHLEVEVGSKEGSLQASLEQIHLYLRRKQMQFARRPIK
jgi:hypothetical protein